MFGYLLLMLLVLLNSAVSQDTLGDHQCGPGQEQCVQNSVERMRYEMDAMQDDFRRVIKQLSTENTLVREDLQKVIQEVKECTSNVQRLTREDQTITADLQQVKNSTRTAGSTYIRWGRTICPNGTQTLYRGYTAGSSHVHSGGGSNYICLHSQPEWGRDTNGLRSGGYIYGTDYRVFENNPFSNSGQTLLDHDAPCAACYTPKSATIMIPARTTCPDGWGKEYGGYVMAGADSHKGRTTHVCVDGDPEVREGGSAGGNGANLYITAVHFLNLPRPPYVFGRALACVVCSK